MADNFIERLMQPGDQTLGLSGPDGGACLVDDPDDTSFIRKPTPDEEEAWARTCAGCRAFNDCAEWADGATGVYVAGEWRE